MYSGSGAGGAVFEMLVLDAATSIFQIAIVYILFHVISLAGGGDAGSVRDNNTYATQASTRFSSNASNLAGKGLTSVGNVAGKLGQKGWQKLKGWTSK